MRLTHWLSRLSRQRLGSRRFSRRKRNADTAQAVELLEDRTLLSTFTVNTTADTVDADPGDGVSDRSSYVTGVAHIVDGGGMVG